MRTLMRRMRGNMEERIIDRMMLREAKIGKARVRAVDLVFILCLFLFAFLIRWKLMPIESADYWGFSFSGPSNIQLYLPLYVSHVSGFLSDRE